MGNFKSLLAIAFLAFFYIIAYTPVLQFEHNNTHTMHLLTFNLTIADDRASFRIRGRGGAFDPRGGRGTSTDGRNAVELGPRLAQDNGFPIATYRSTLHNANSTTFDTIDTLIQAMPSHHASHNITVRLRHVENGCGGHISRNSPTPKNNIFTAFTPDSRAE